MSADSAIVILKYLNKETDTINYRAAFVQAPENLFASYWYVFKTFHNTENFSIYSLVDSHVTNLMEKYGTNLEYGIITLNLSSKTWEQIEDYATNEFFRYSKIQP